MPISGLYEIHITVEERDMFEFRKWCMEMKFKPILAVSSSGNQLMFSKYVNRESEEEAIAEAKRLQDDLIKRQMAVTRVKVEAMGSNPGVPVEANDGNGRYFEFHIKMPVDNVDHFSTLQTCLGLFIGEHVKSFMSFNAFKRETVPLATLRVDGEMGSKAALELKNDWMSMLKSHSFHSNEGMQFEYCVYDTNPTLDRI
jgi:hypothetical protein